MVDFVADRIARLRLSTHHAASVLQARDPSAQIAAAKNRLGDLTHRQTRAVEAGLTRRRQHQTRTAHALELLGPRQTLERGFTMTLDTARRPLTAAHQARREEKIVPVFADGEIGARPETYTASSRSRGARRFHIGHSPGAWKTQSCASASCNMRR
ncbi:MAG: exodeoxyribonuclease VII large subunit [Chthoniobacterales bacterium]